MIDFPPPLPPPLVAQDDIAHKNFEDEEKHKTENSLVNSKLSFLLTQFFCFRLHLLE